MVEVGNIVFFMYRDNKTQAKVIKVTKTRVLLEFKPKTVDNLRRIWKKRDEDWQIQ